MMYDGYFTLFALLIRAVFAAGGAAIASRKNRNVLVWCLVCLIFSWMGLIVIAVLPKVARDEKTRSSTTAEQASSADAPVIDEKRWAELVAADADLAAGVERLRPYGERYVKELAATLLASDGPHVAGPLIDGLLAKAKADAESANVDELARHVDHIYRAARGPVAVLSDGRALAQFEGNFYEFRYVTDYRVVYLDRGDWEEITDAEEKRRFYLAAREPLERINAGLSVAPSVPSAKSTARPSDRGVGSLLGRFAKRTPSQSAEESQPPGSRDDLTLISGLDARLERSLNARGITRYVQIASWTAADVEQISAALGLKDLIRQENWIGQAKLLMPHYARCPECGHVYDAIELAACPRHLSPGAQPASNGAGTTAARPLQEQLLRGLETAILDGAQMPKASDLADVEAARAPQRCADT
jgi:predicted flap endonuclease-1-like 5' DNA nuclease